MHKPLTASHGTLRPTLTLAWPVLVEQLLVMMVGLVDLWLTGRFLEQRHMAAIGSMSYVLWLIPCTFGIVAIGALALTARFVGARDMKSANLVTNQAVLAGILVAAVITLLAALFGDRFIRLTQLKPDAAPLAIEYLRIITPVIPAIMLQVVGIACLRGAGDTFSGFVVMAIVNVVNIAVGASLVLGIGPFPELGWRGLAIGTACGYAVGSAVVVAMLVAGRRGLQLKKSLLRPDWQWLRRILRIGLPGGTDQVAVVCCHLWFLSIINSLGTLPAAAHGLAVRIESLAYLPGAAFQVAAATLAGQFLGAGDRRRAARSVLVALSVGGSLMTGAGVLFFLAGGWLTQLFLGQQTGQTADLAVPLLKIVALAMPAFAVMTILTGGLRGAGDTRWPLLFTFAGFLLVRIPLAHYFAWEQFTIPWLDASVAGLGLGVVGAWYAMLIDIQIRGILVGWRFAHGGWRHVRV